MSVAELEVDPDRALSRLLRFLAVEGITGQEKAIAAEVARHLRESGVPPGSMHYDTANQRIPLPTEIGNLVVDLPGTRPGPRLLFSTHLDTVPLCQGAVPVRVGKDRIKAQGETALGGDNRTGVACLVTLAATLLEQNLPHPPITLLFTVREESGLYGSRHLDPADLGNPVMGFNVDGKSPSEMTIGAVGAERWEVEIFGRASHAGVHPEQGISATMVAALALSDVYRNGWFGKIKKDGKEGTANVGSVGGHDGFSAGEATNVVTDYVHVRGEARSHDTRFVKAITKVYREAFEKAGNKVGDHKGRKARVKFTSRLDYHPFKLRTGEPVVKRAMLAANALGLSPLTRIGNGGLDANWLVRHKIPTVTFGAGQHNIHTIDEYVDLPLFMDGCRLAVALATWDA